MTLIEYIKAKYPSGNIGMTKTEAAIFNIEYPLKNGWLSQNRNIQVNLSKYRLLKNFLERKQDQHSKKALEFLNQHFADDHMELVKSAISATFPKVDLLTQENIQACAHFLSHQEESNDEIRGFVSTLLRTLHPSHIAELKRQLLQA